jgi:hypothetical protein
VPEPNALPRAPKSVDIKNINICAPDFRIAEFVFRKNVPEYDRINIAEIGLDSLPLKPDCAGSL